MLPKVAVCLLLLALLLVIEASNIDTSRFYVKKDLPPNDKNRRSGEASSSLSATSARRESSFDPDVLNRFLEEYASKIKRTTERPVFGFDKNTKVPQNSQDIEAISIETDVKDDSNTTRPFEFIEPARMNDTIKRHKFYSGNNPFIEDRNSGWVTLDAIPWSKSKISKWQANPTQSPWPDLKPWDKPSFNKPWNSDYPSGSASSYDNGKPWQHKKPHWSDNAQSGSNKPWYSERPRPNHNERPSYSSIDKYKDNPNQAQKWPPERPSWDRESSRPSLDIDNGSPNFPTNNWEKPGQRPSYTHHTESYVNEPNSWHDNNDFPNNCKYCPSDDGYYNRPHFSHYNYPSTSISNGVNGGTHPPSHPSSGDGQWVLLSTNRGYSKSRQRSLKFDSLVNTETKQSTSNTKNQKNLPPLVAGNVENVPAVTSKRQIRLTVLPSLNGTNTTTSHGGLLEVERTFKTVEESQKEYEQEKTNNNTNQPIRPLGTKILVNKRPIRNTLLGGTASSSAVLAAVGAGMLPATMAMMIPMMLGKRRRRRSIARKEQVTFLSLPGKALVKDTWKKKKI